MDTVEQVFGEYQIDPSLARRRDEMFRPMPFTMPIDIAILMDQHGQMDVAHYEAMHTAFKDRNIVVTSIIKWRVNALETWISSSEWQAAKALVRREMACYHPRVVVVVGIRGYDLLDVVEQSWSNTWRGWMTRTGKLVLDGLGNADWIPYAARFLDAEEEMLPRA